MHIDFDSRVRNAHSCSTSETGITHKLNKRVFAACNADALKEESLAELETVDKLFEMEEEEMTRKKELLLKRLAVKKKYINYSNNRSVARSSISDQPQIMIESQSQKKIVVYCIMGK